MNLAFVIQRYGEEVAGGAEAHCRGLVNALKARHQVEVLTTCALDYITWKNHYPPGESSVDGVRVRRFPNTQERDIRRFASKSEHVFYADRISPHEERRWLQENGPVCPELIEAIAKRTAADFVLLYSYRYYTAALGAGAAGNRAILIPTAEDDPAVRLSIFAELFRSVRGLLYLTPEEQHLVENASGTKRPSVIIGSGLTLPTVEPAAAARFDLPAPYVLYAGRIDRNKGVDTLFRYYEWLTAEWQDAPMLVLAGHQVLDIPTHPRIRYIGYVTDAEKAALLAGAAVVLMPSALESLSILVLEAWAVGTPVLVNGRCRVLEGQCRRSNGGFYYRDFAEFAAMLRILVARPELRHELGASGRAYVEKEYSWEIAAKRTEALLNSLT